VIMPMFLFSGTFFPLSSMPIYLQPIGWISPLWHATELGREAAYDYGIGNVMVLVHFIVLVSLVIIGLALSTRQFEKRLAK
jgi:lipooligosaccharide transport system permease protein